MVVGMGVSSLRVMWRSEDRSFSSTGRSTAGESEEPAGDDELDRPKVPILRGGRQV